MRVFVSIVITILLIGCSESKKHVDHTLHITFDSVRGLKTGDSVFFNEESIGAVKDLQLAGKNHDSVDVLVEFYDYIPPVPKPSRFVLETDGIKGGQQIRIVLLPRSGEDTYAWGSSIPGMIEIEIEQDPVPLGKNRLEIKSLDSTLKAVRQLLESDSM